MPLGHLHYNNNKEIYDESHDIYIIGIDQSDFEGLVYRDMYGLELNTHPVSKGRIHIASDNLQTELHQIIYACESIHILIDWNEVNPKWNDN